MAGRGSRAQPREVAARRQDEPDAFTLFAPLVLSGEIAPSPEATRVGTPTAEPSSTPSAGPSAMPTTGAPGTPTAGPSSTPTAGTPGTVRTTSGDVSGALVAGAWRFLGMPYAAPPLGDLRWRAPAAPEPWQGALEADAFGPACPQYDDGSSLFGDEDCLTLNVFAPPDVFEQSDARPVLFFIHGGGHVQGAGSVSVGDHPLYDGTTLAVEHGVVVVTINYRLGPFGFLAHPALTAEGGEQASGNYGALDQLAALRWVHDNIAGFGGDPERVTVFGESAGSVSACRLVASPLAAGLVHRAILMSGACVATPLDTAEQDGVAVAEELGCADAPDVPACLRARSMASVMDTLGPGVSGPGSLARGAYDGVIDGYLLPAAPRELIEAGRHNQIPVIVGTTSAESGRDAPPITTEAEYEAAVRAYLAAAGLPPVLAPLVLAAYPTGDYPSPRDAFVALSSDVKFVCQARRDLRLLSSGQEEPTYRYWFDHVPDNVGETARSRGAFHGLELTFLFGVLDVGIGPLRYEPGPGDLAVSAAMQGYWARFAASGDPNGGAAAWPIYDIERDPSLVLAPEPHVAEGLRAEQCDFWDALGGRD